MPAAKYNLEVEQGATFTLALAYKDANDVPINLTGYSARMQIRHKAGSASALIDATTANGKIVLVAADGGITVTVPATDTDALTVTTGVYDLEIEDASSVVTRLLQGTVAISKGVTR